MKKIQKIIENIFETIEQKSKLKYPDFNKDFTLETDACEKAIGAVLKQGDKVICILSKKLNKTEMNYSIVEKEVLAVIKAFIHFKTIIFNSRVNACSDNMNVVNTSEITGRISRWKLLLEEYDYMLTHVPGEKIQ